MYKIKLFQTSSSYSSPLKGRLIMFDQLTLIIRIILLILLIFAIPFTAYKLGLKYKENQLLGIILYILVVILYIILFIIDLLKIL